MRRAAASLLLCVGLLSCTTTERVATVDPHAGPSPSPSSSPPSPSPSSSTAPTTGPPAPPVDTTGHGEPSTDPGSQRSTVLPDSLFPDLGSAAIDVQSYDVDLSFDPADRQLSGSVTMTIEAVADLASFELDAEGPQIKSVDVDGRPATFVQRDAKLEITPPNPIESGTSFVVEVTYHQDTEADQARSDVGPISTGWFNTLGGAYVLNEPEGAHHYLPSNDHPSDKATWTVTLRVPAGLTGVSNGELVAHDTTTAGEIYTWRESAPMATYLLQILVGKYTIIEGQVPGGPKLLSVILSDQAASFTSCLDSMTAQIEFFEQYFGPYPFDRYGMAVTDSVSGLAMETQGRSLFSVDDMHGCPNGIDGLTAHELAHQWFGNSVTPARWKDIWLNESFATYGEWMWSTRNRSIDVRAAPGLRLTGGGSIADPTVDEMFSGKTYDGGAAVLNALRITVGDNTFFEILRRWVTDNFGRSVTTEDFVDLCERVSGKQLDDFFQTWLYASDPPATYPTPAP